MFCARPIRFLSRVLHAPKGLVAVLLVVLTYGTIGLLLALAGIRITATITSLVQQIPSLYSAYILPELTDFFAWLEELLAKLDPSSCPALQERSPNCSICCGSWSSSLSVVLVGGVSIATSFATSLPGFLIRLLLMVISTFFIAVDYQKIVRFCLAASRGAPGISYSRSRRMWWERCSSASAPTPSSCPSPLWNYPLV